MIDRALAWSRLERPLDVLVVGGGVTGAAVLFEAARRGLRAGLVERCDFASGTSSRSSKLVHGGLRYLKEGKIGLTRESVREREELLRDAPGLVDPIDFVMPHYAGRKPGRATMDVGLALYDALAGTWRHRYAGRDETLALIPALDARGLQGAHVYGDACTDDARLVLRLIQEACDAGATAVNYAQAALVLDAAGSVCGARVTGTGEAVGGGAHRADVRATVVIAATGVFADELRAEIGAAPRLRPLRGSHVLLPGWRLPLAAAVAFSHPNDGRPVFAYPWLGATLAGTTDLDHARDLRDEPAIAPAESAYVLAALNYQFPHAKIGADDVVATYAGVRPVIGARSGDPSKASRDHLVLEERGLITVTGGKLTTFRPMALAALAAAAARLPAFDRAARPVFGRVELARGALLPAPACARLAGRFGPRAAAFLETARANELERIGDTDVLWAELRWAAQHEAVIHLDDMLLRRTRLGLLLERGGERLFERLRPICMAELGWNAARWDEECERYRYRWAHAYAMPAAS